jgi:alkylation response protein AidB-like acyl-CoA dehydrogenase
MTKYIAPVDEVNFVLTHLCQMEELQKLPGFEDATPDIVNAILQEAGKFSEEELAELNWSGDQSGATIDAAGVKAAPGFKEAYNKFVESGWISLAQPQNYGGQGLPFTLHMAASEFWNSSNMAFALCPMLSASGIDALLAHGSDELKRQYLEKMISGEWAGTMLLTEPQAGSDLAALRSKAVPNGDHYLISGNKIFITWGDHDMTENIIQFVLARLPNAPAGVKGISLFLVPKFLVNDDGSIGELNDSKASSIEHKLGINASPTCVMNLGEKKGAVGYLVGEKNTGLACMFTMMIHARLEVGLEGVSLSERSYQGAVDYARQRIQGEKPGHEGKVCIAEHADVRRMLMLMRCLTEASRALCYVGSTSYDHSKRNTDDALKSDHQTRMDLLIPILKGWSTEIAQEVTSLGLQVAGGMGYIEETGMAQHYRDARITTIYEGTTGIQSNDLIGRKLLRDKGAGMNSLINDMKVVVVQLSQAELKDIAVDLQKGIDSLESAVKSIFTNAKSNYDFAGSVSVNLLMLAGTVCGAWQMARSAIAVQLDTESSDTELSTEFCNNKLATTRFYMKHVLPRALAYQQTIETTGDCVMGIPVGQL